MHEEGQGCRSWTPNRYQDIQCCSTEGMGCPSGISPGGRTVWEWARVGSQWSRQARRHPTPPQSTSQVYPGRAADNPAGHPNETVRAYASAGNPRLQTTAICSETSKRMQWQAEGATPQPLLRRTDMQSNQGVAWACPDNRRHGLAAPRRRISGQDYHTGRYHSSQERCATLGKRQRSQNRNRGLDVVEWWIALRRWLSGSHCSVQTWKSMEVSPQLSGQ